jgi:glycosyltransferase involved in cell wall biosynthesis
MAESVPGKPVFTVITVTKNSERYLEQTILSVIGQKYPGLEYAIIDGGSTDGTLEIIKKYQDRVAYWSSEPDRGIYDAVNKGIRVSTGEIIGIIHSDDYYESDAIAKVVEAFRRDPQGEVFHGNVMMRTAGDQQLRVSHPNIKYDRIWHKMILRHPACFITRTAYAKYGLYDLGYPIAADYELFLRFYKMGARFHYLDEVMAHMREGGISHRRQKESWRECRRIAIAHGLAPWRAYFDYYNKLIKL